MARPLRIQTDGAVYHVLSRGNRNDFILDRDDDKNHFLTILAAGVKRHGIDLYAYSLMGNHYHLLLSSPGGNLTAFMHFLGSTLAGHLSRQRNWIGHVFAGRYRSLCVEKEPYLAELSRYVHLNPCRSRTVKTAEEYPWSSYRCYVGIEVTPPWLNTEWILRKYGANIRVSRRRYRAFVIRGMGGGGSYLSRG